MKCLLASIGNYPAKGRVRNIASPISRNRVALRKIAQELPRHIDLRWSDPRRNFRGKTAVRALFTGVPERGEVFLVFPLEVG